MSQFGGVERPGQWETAGDHERRIRALEALRPCCDDSGGSLTPCVDVIAELATSEALLGYWRLGEPSGTFADTSGQALPADGTETAVSIAMTRDIAGALPANQDDGAVQFNASDGIDSDYITTDTGGDNDRFNLTNADMSISAWVNPTASASSFVGNVVGQMAVGTGVQGWRFYVSWPLRQAVFHRAQSGGGTSVSLTGDALADDTWTFVVCTYSSTNGHRIYYNGSLNATDATTFGGIGNNNAAPKIGRGGVGSTTLQRTFYGGVDEVAVWEDELTAEQIQLLVDCAGTGDAEAGMVLTADGNGGTYWAFPTIEVLEDGV